MPLCPLRWVGFCRARRAQIDSGLPEWHSFFKIFSNFYGGLDLLSENINIFLFNHHNRTFQLVSIHSLALIAFFYQEGSVQISFLWAMPNGGLDPQLNNYFWIFNVYMTLDSL